MRLYCPTCEEVLALPQGGAIKLFQGLACPLDGYELVRPLPGTLRAALASAVRHVLLLLLLLLLLGSQTCPEHSGRSDAGCELPCWYGQHCWIGLDAAG